MKIIFHFAIIAELHGRSDDHAGNPFAVEIWRRNAHIGKLTPQIPDGRVSSKVIGNGLTVTADKADAADTVNYTGTFVQDIANAAFGGCASRGSPVSNNGNLVDNLFINVYLI